MIRLVESVRKIGGERISFIRVTSCPFPSLSWWDMPMVKFSFSHWCARLLVYKYRPYFICIKQEWTESRLVKKSVKSVIRELTIARKHHFRTVIICHMRTLAVLINYSLLLLRIKENLTFTILIFKWYLKESIKKLQKAFFNKLYKIYGTILPFP